jgi:HK97 family phage prohead protease
MNLIPLHDGRPGLRTLLQIEARSPWESEIANQKSQIEIASEAPCLDFISSTASLDRFHEMIDPAGWHLDSYRRNPVFQNAHNYGDILFTLGKALVTDVRTVSGRQALFQRVQFATDVNPIARIAYGLYQGKFLNAVSVGFIPLRWEDSPPETSENPRRRYLEQELLEVSAVAIPANPEALALAVKSGAVEKSDLRESLALVLEVERTVPARRDSLSVPLPNFYAELFQFACELRRILRSA